MSTVKTNNVQIGQSVTATNNFTWYQPSTPDGTVRLGVGNSGATSSDVVTVNSSGNVGIGTSSPSSKLHVVSDGVNSKFGASTSTASSTSQWLNGTGGMYIGVDNSTGSQFVGAPYSGNIWVSGAYPLCIAVNGSERMRLDASGNLGLGVTPSYRLDCAAGSTGSKMFRFTSTGANKYMYGYCDSGGTGITMSAGQTASLALYIL